MFSGIIERMGTVERIEGATAGMSLAIRGGWDADPVEGESVAVNGVCLTVERVAAGVFEASAVEETLRRTTLRNLSPGRRVNVEKALRVGDALGGHWVQGHVDAVAEIRAVTGSPADVRVGIEVPESLRRYVAEKGSITVDGASLTVAAWSEPIAVVALVPYTLRHTIASEYVPGGFVNLEVDVLARYLERLLEARGALRGLGEEVPTFGRGR